MSKKMGFSISVEGVDGCGKDTAIGMLKKHFEALGYEVEVFADLYSTETGVKVREIFIEAQEAPDEVTTMALLTAARRELVNKRIIPALREGKVVLLNRFKDSTVAYQCFARDPSSTMSREERIASGPAMVRMLESLYIAGNVNFVPDRTIWFKIDPIVQEQRMTARGKKDRYDAGGREWHALVAEGFQWCYEQDCKLPLIERRFSCCDNSTVTLEELDKMLGTFVSLYRGNHENLQNIQ